MSALPERLARVRATADQARERRNGTTDCSHARDHHELVHIFRSGARHVYRGCADCGRPLEPGRWLPNRAAGDLEVGIDERMCNPPCVRCGAFGTELHHFAPRAIFGPEEAELWPTAYLCGGCHRYWHATINNTPAQTDLGF